MLLRSFRLRMALWSMLAAGVAAAGFGAMAWWSIRQTELLKLDHDLSARGLRELGRPEGPGHWGLLEVILAETQASGQRDRVLILALDSGNQVRYRSAHWPKGLEVPLPPATPLPPPPWGPPSSERFADPESARRLNGDESQPRRLGGAAAGGEKRPDEAGGSAAIPPPAPGSRVADDVAPLQRVPTPQPRRAGSDQVAPAPFFGGPPPGDRRPGLRPPGGPFEREEGWRGGGEIPRPPGFPPERRGLRPPVHEPGDLAPLQRPRRGDAGPPDGHPAPIPRSDLHGEMRSVSLTLAQADPRLPPGLRVRPPLDPPEWFTLPAAGKRWRLAVFTAPERRLVLGIDLGVVDDTMGAVRNGFFLALPVALVLIALGAWFLSDRALRPLRRLSGSIRRITAQGLSERVASAREDREFEELITVFNAMLERLERGFLQASRFSADAAHELKTPLAILQGEIERALQQVEPGSAIQATLGGLLAEVRRLSAISRKLLLLAQADAGGLRVHRQTFDLSRALSELADDARLLAPNISVREAIAPGLSLRADPDLLRQLLQNLISNAIKYNLPAGWVEIAARSAGSHLEVAISNASPGIAVADRERIFERFFRADPSRSRQREGVGLGLALAREIARAHDGDLRLAASAERETRFVLVLPR